MLKRSDYIIISIICFFLGIFFISQFYAGKKYEKVIQPENNAVLAIEVAKLTSTNADLRREVQDLTSDLDSYRNSSNSYKSALDKYQIDSNRLDSINGISSRSGQGIIIIINGRLLTPQVVDLVNALKNIGVEMIEINGEHLILNTDLGKFGGRSFYEIKVLGNSNLLRTAMERKGGIVEQIANKDIVFKIEESDNINISPTIAPFSLKNARIVN